MERMRHLRDECNQTPSSLWPKPRTAKLAAITVEGLARSISKGGYANIGDANIEVRL